MPEKYQITETEVRSRCGNYYRSFYPYPLAYMEYVWITADPSRYGIKWIVAGWSHRGECAVIDYGIARGFQELWEEANRAYTFSIVNSRFVQQGLINDGFDTREVREFCYNSGGFFRPAKGVGGSAPHKNIIQCFTIHNRVFDYRGWAFLDVEFKKMALLSRIGGMMGADVPGLWFPKDIEQPFIDELCAESMVMGPRGDWQWVTNPNCSSGFADALALQYVNWEISQLPRAERK